MKSMSYWKGHGEAVSASVEVRHPSRGRAAVKGGHCGRAWFPGRFDAGPVGCVKRGRTRAPVCSALSPPSASRRHFPLLGVGGWGPSTWRPQRRLGEVRRAGDFSRPSSQEAGVGAPAGLRASVSVGLPALRSGAAEVPLPLSRVWRPPFSVSSFLAAFFPVTAWFLLV